MTAPRRVVVTEAVHSDALALLEEAGWQIIGPELQDADALLVRTKRIEAVDVARFGVISKHGVGVDNIALDAARKAGVCVMNTPGANAAAVAEQTILMILALLRGLDAQRAAYPSPIPVRGAEGTRLLVVGYGASGARVAMLASALGMVVTVLSRSVNAARHAGFGVATDFALALRHTDVVTLHCPLTDDTRNLLNAKAMALLPAGAFVVNCARGGLIDEAALASALHAGHLGGAALDVTEEEPLPQGHALRDAPRLILTPHLAAQSHGAFRRMGMMAAQNILDHFAGKAPAAHVVVASD
jgi:D-3-phosphoglycerate dehydrogenase